MTGKNFAFESEDVSISFHVVGLMGDWIMARKVFDAIVELVPDCVVDCVCLNENNKTFAKAFYSDCKNINRLVNVQEYANNMQKYDLALYVGGCHAIFFEWINPERLQAMAPDFLQRLGKINQFNQMYVHNMGPWKLTVAFRNMISAKILSKNCFRFLSYNGALPIHDDKIKIPLAPEYKAEFDKLKLDKYITIYTDLTQSERDRPKVKAWPVRCFTEYIARMRKRFPEVEIVQVGKNDVEVENADRHFLDVDLELTKYILANSLLHVGGEGGLVHLATALGTKCLVLFGSNSCDYTGYARNINLISEVCSPCMYIVPDFQVCMRGNKEPPCMLYHTPQHVCEVTCNYLKRLDLEK